MALVTFNKSSKSIMSAVNYFESDKDHTNTIRKFKPIPVFGDRERIEKLENLAKESGIENTHTSLTISFRDNEFSEFKNSDGSYNQEKLIPAMKEIIKDFRETWFPGMKTDENFADFWNIHTDKGNIELNCAFLKMELTTGKAFNPFPPGELNQNMRDCYVDLLNDKFGFDRVIRNPFSISHNDMELKDIQNPSETAKRFKEVVKPKKTEVQKFLTSQILDNKINSRKELIDTLQQHGEVNFLDKEEDREKYNYISFVPEGSDKAMRLDGPMFKKNADFNELRIEHKNNQAMEKDDSLKQLSDKERTSKQEKLNKHKEIQKGYNEKLKNSGVKNVKKNSGRKYLPKSKKPKKLEKPKEKISNIKNEPQQQSNQNTAEQSADSSGVMKKLLNEVREENKQSVKKQETFEKTDNKKQVTNKPSEPIIIKNSNNKESKNSGSKPSISSFSQVATSSNASLLTVQINQVLFSKLSLELQIGSLSIFKESDIKKIFELKQKIAELELQISVLKAKQEQAIEAELINQNANRFKNSSSPMKLRI
jgi:hypothetical protein